MDFMDLFTKGGIIAVLGYIIYFIIKKVFEHFNKSETSDNDVLLKLVEQSRKKQEDDFTLLKDMIATNLLQTEEIKNLKLVIIEKTDDIKHLILNNTWCPYYRELVKKKENPNE